MTDLTILIAVIALALWPLAFLVLRIRHERKKRRDRLDRMTKEDLEDIGTEELVIAVLKKIGCQPEPMRKDILSLNIKVMIFILRWRMRPGSS